MLNVRENVKNIWKHQLKLLLKYKTLVAQLEYLVSFSKTTDFQNA